MRNLFIAALAFHTLLLPLAAIGEEELDWKSREGGSIRARFLRLSGEVLIVVQDGRERRIPMGKLSQESASQARRLAGELNPADIERPLPMKHVLISVEGLLPADRLRKDSTPRPGGSNGTFEMGSPSDEPDREEWEPRHLVILRHAFLLKSTEVTRNEWNSVRRLAEDYGYLDLSAGSGGNAGDPDGNHPVVGITWWDALKWCNLFSQIDGLTPAYHDKSGKILTVGTPEVQVDWEASGYRLPTEAEWEFACRPGTSNRAYHSGLNSKTGKLESNLEMVGWFVGNSDGSTQPVAEKSANHFGLYDMHGNAAEWCWDRFGELSDATVTDPKGAETGTNRVTRGGSWMDPAEKCRAASRGSRNPAAIPNPSVGFRTLRIAKPELGR